MANFFWAQISVLRFFHEVSCAKCEELVSQATVNIIASQEHDINFTESTDRDEESDEIFINRKNDSFIIINSDLKKLYRMRPRAVKNMTFCQFAISYYRMRACQQAVIDPQSNIGEESGDPVVGGEERAPKFMKLSNQVLENF